MRLALIGLLASTVFMALPASSGGLGEMTAPERDAFRAEVRAYLIENPEVLVEAMNELQARDALSAAALEARVLQDQAELIFNDPASWVGGNPNGDITIVEFLDYRCGYCRKAEEELMELLKSDGNIRFIVKEFPILGEQSLLSSRFAIAVRQLHGDDAYKTAHDALITMRGDATPEALARLASEMGLEAQPILDRMDSEAVNSIIVANQALADLLQIGGTPTFVIDQTLVRGYVPLDEMRQIVAEQRGL